MPFINHKTLTIIILATFFGLMAGIAGQIISQSYILSNNYNIPLFGELVFNGNNTNGQSLIIRSPRNVVVEQNVKVQETISSVSGSLVGIFNKIATSSNPGSEINLSEQYLRNKPQGTGFIITSDGWIISNFTPALLAKAEIATTTKINELKKYVIFTNENKFYQVDDLIYDQVNGYSFWHIDENDLPVKNFANHSALSSGQVVLGVNWQQMGWVSTIVSKISPTAPLIKSSDSTYRELILQESPSEAFYNSFLFSLDGSLVAVIEKNGRINPVSNFKSCITCLLEDTKIKRAKLGVIYISLSDLAGDNSTLGSDGALIYPDQNNIAVKPGSAAAKAGLVAGDILLKVNNITLDKNNLLSDIVASARAGDEIIVEYQRGKEKNIITIELSE